LNPFIGRHTLVFVDRAENPEKLRARPGAELNVNRVNLKLNVLVGRDPFGMKRDALRTAARQAARCAACRRTVAFAVRDAVARAVARACALAVARAWALAVAWACLRAVALALALACARAVAAAFSDAFDRFLFGAGLACGRVFAAARVTLCAALADTAAFAGDVTDTRDAAWVATFTACVARRADTAARRVVCRPQAIKLSA
jgi:hypothetical protein